MIMALPAELSLLIVDHPGSRAVRAYSFQPGCDTHAARTLPCFWIGMMSCEATAAAGDAWLLAQAWEADSALLLGGLT